MSKKNKRHNNRNQFINSNSAEKPGRNGRVLPVTTIVDIVIPVYNGFEILADCLKVIPDAVGSLPYHVVLVDNASKKHEADVFYATLIRDPHFTVIRNLDNTGYPRACNDGAVKRSSPLILFLNTDVVLQPGAIESMARTLDDPQVGICGAKLLFPENSPSGPAGKIQHVGLCVNMQGTFVHLFLGWSPDHPRVLAVHEVVAVTGACLMVRRSLWEKAGGYDSVFGMGTYEDADLCMKVIGMGGRIVVDQKAVGTHYTGYTTIKENVAFPLTVNDFLFKSRWAGKYGWNQWVYL